MKTGIEFITEERTEQIERGFTPEHDSKYKNGELKKAAAFVITKDPYHFPATWSEEWFHKLQNKKGIEALKVAGALIAAEIDRLEKQNG